MWDTCGRSFDKAILSDRHRLAGEELHSRLRQRGATLDTAGAFLHADELRGLIKAAVVGWAGGWNPAVTGNTSIGTVEPALVLRAFLAADFSAGSLDLAHAPYLDCATGTVRDVLPDGFDFDKCRL